MKVKIKVRDRIVLWIWIALCVVLYALILRSCVRVNFPSDKRRSEIEELFDSLPHTDSYALVRYSRWIVGGETYDELPGSTFYLDQNGFYTYSTSFKTVPTISFYYVKYEDMEPELVGTSILPSSFTPSNVAYYDGNFYFEATTQGEDGYSYRFFRWNPTDNETVETDDYRSFTTQTESDYDFDFVGYLGFSTYRWFKRVKITEKSTGITKTVGKKILKTFPEGKEIYRAGPSAGKFIATARLVSGDDIYFLFRFSVGLPDNGVDCYYYIVKWNFHTEECTFITTVEGFDSGCDHFLLFD